MLDAIEAGNVSEVRNTLALHPELLGRDWGMGTWLHHAARERSVELASLLIELGFDVNAAARTTNGARGEVPLLCAIDRNNLEMAKLLLAHGAETNTGLPVIGVIVGDNINSLELVKLLVDHGADIHVVYPFGEKFTPMNALKMSLVWGKMEIAEYLRSLGARMPEDYAPDELKRYLPSDGSWSFAAVAESTASPADETVA
jgi:ankyrin repeat protein